MTYDRRASMEIEVMGHKAKVGWIKSLLKNPPFQKEDCLSVFIDLEEPFNGTSGFFTTIPIKNYGKEELIETIRMNAESDLKVILEKSHKDREEHERKKAREEELDQFGESLMQILSK